MGIDGCRLVGNVFVLVGVGGCGCIVVMCCEIGVCVE